MDAVDSFITRDHDIGNVNVRCAGGLRSPPWTACTEAVNNPGGSGCPHPVHSRAHSVAHKNPETVAHGIHRRIVPSIACTSDRSDASSLRRSMIFWTAEMTVVWCLPPNARARSG